MTRRIALLLDGDGTGRVGSDAWQHRLFKGIRLAAMPGGVGMAEVPDDVPSQRACEFSVPD